MGIGNLESVLRAYGRRHATSPTPSSTSTRRPSATPPPTRSSPRFGDDSSNYCWKLGAAKEIMRLCRNDPAELARLTAAADGQGVRRGGAAPGRPHAALPHARDAQARVGRRAARRRSRERARHRPAARPEHGRARAAPGTAAGALPRAAPRGARDGALHRRRGARDQPARPADRDLDRARRRLPALLVRTQPRGDARLLAAHDRLDVRHRAPVRSKRQALAFQFVLDRLQVLNAIAWVREPDAIHITVSSDARVLLPAARSREYNQSDDRRHPHA